MDGITIQYGKFDPGAKADSTPTSTQNQPFADINDLRYDNISVEKNAGTFEHNYIILNGTMEEMPDAPTNFHWGWWTLDASDDYGDFQEPYPALEILFDNPHSSNGITLYFYPFTNDYANKIKLTWYNEYGAVIKSGIYENNNIMGAVGEFAAQYTRIKAEMLSTNNRNRFVKIYAIDYGKGKVFLDDEIEYCDILEEIDPASEMLSINTMKFQTKTHNPEFSHVSGDIKDEMLMINQQMKVFYYNQPFGVFFLKDWKDVYNTGTVFDFNTEDAVGALDSYEFMGGIYEDILAEGLIQEIFNICFPTKLIDFVLDEALRDKRVSGYIPKSKCRTALQYICFAIGAIADTSRRDFVWIYPLEPILERTITRDKIYISDNGSSGSIESTKYFTGVDVVSHTYMKGDEVKKIYDDVIEAGEHTFNFTEPLHALSINGGIIMEHRATYAKINVPAKQHLTFTGLNYIVAQIPYSVRSELLPGEIGRVKIYDGCTLVSRADTRELANRLFMYLNTRKLIEIPVRLEDLECGYLTKVLTYGRPIIGTIEQLDIKLRGYRATLKLLGDVYPGGELDYKNLAQLGTLDLNSIGGLI